MRTVIYLGPERAIVVGGTSFPRGEQVCISDVWFTAHGGAFPPGEVRTYESLVTDVLPQSITYRLNGAAFDITAIIPQFRTPDLTTAAAESFKRFYPQVPLILVDDGSGDASTRTVLALAERLPRTSALVLARNRGHGVAVDTGIRNASTRRVFVMDSDCVVEHGGFLEQMENRMLDAGLYAIGVLYYRDWVTTAYHNYLSCVAALYDRDVYLTLPPFEHHGDPMQQNMRAAAKRGLEVECFPIFDYVWHMECGTRKRYDNAWDLTNLDAVAQKRILVYGSSYVAEVCVKALLAGGYNVVGHIPNAKEPTVPGMMPVPVVDTEEPHELKLSIQYDQLIAMDGHPGFNLHTGLLPDWGGTDILYHTLRRGASFQGLTFHQMTDRYDQGPILAKIEYPVLSTDDMVSLYRRMVRLAPRFIVSCMELLDDVGLDNVQRCPAYPPTLYRRGQVAPEDVALYRETPAKLRELFERSAV